jgi:hypothetical protein
MNRQLLSFAVAALTLVFAGVASAQTYSPAHSHDHDHHHGGASYQPYPYGGYHSSTYEEGVLRGMGAYNASLGQMNYLNSLAAINNEQAYAQRLINAENRTETYFRLKQINAAARAAERSPRLTQDEYVSLARKQAPDRLTEVDYDRATGRLNWPAVLLDESSALERSTLDTAFAARTPSDFGAGSPFNTLVKQATYSLQSKLQARLATMSPAEFIAAKKFITGLAYESQQPLAAAAIAAR